MSLAGPFELKLYLSECCKCKDKTLSSLWLSEKDTALGPVQTRCEQLWVGQCSGERVPFTCGGLRIWEPRLKGELGMPAGLRAIKAAQS